MKRLILFLLIYSYSLNIAISQEYVEILTGTSYGYQVYYSFEEDEIVTINNDSWDFAFTTGSFNAGILINESASLGGTSIELFLSPTNNFSVNINISEIKDTLTNNEKSWEEGCAFLALFSLKQSASIAVSPNWDLFFCRYGAFIHAGGDIVSYNVSGVLSGFRVKVEEAKDFNDFDELDYKPYLDSMDTEKAVVQLRRHNVLFLVQSVGNNFKIY